MLRMFTNRYQLHIKNEWRKDDCRCSWALQNISSTKYCIWVIFICEAILNAMINQDVGLPRHHQRRSHFDLRGISNWKALCTRLSICVRCSNELFKEFDCTVMFAATDFPRKQVSEFHVTSKAVLCHLLHSRLETRRLKNVALSCWSTLVATAWSSTKKRVTVHFLA